MKDNDTTALRYFSAAYNMAHAQGDVRNMANALLRTVFTGVFFTGCVYEKSINYLVDFFHALNVFLYDAGYVL